MKNEDKNTDELKPNLDRACGQSEAGCSVPFAKENRYIIIKRTDLMDAMKILNESHLDSLNVLLDFIDATRRNRGRAQIKAVVVESHWPEYEPTWKAIEDRIRRHEDVESPVDKGFGWPPVQA